MDIQGEKILKADRNTVWRALNDPQVLQRCLAGCDTFEADGENRYRVAMAASVGPVRARFTGWLTLRDVNPPDSYALSFEGSGGVAGFGKGSATVALSDAPDGTRLSYTAQAQVGGRLAQVGARLIDGVTRRMADDFFTRFVRELAPAQADSETAHPTGVALATPALLPSPEAHASVSTSAAPSGTLIAVLAAAISATSAAVAVLAAVLAMRGG